MEVQGCTATPIKRFQVFRKLEQLRSAKCCLSLREDRDSTQEYWAVDGAEIMVVDDDGSKGSLGGQAEEGESLDSALVRFPRSLFIFCCKPVSFKTGQSSFNLGC